MDVPEVKKILFSQHTPENFEKSPYADLVRKYGVNIDFYKFFGVTGLTLEQFLSQKISILDHQAVIFTSIYAIEHFFRIANELNINVPFTTRYFCTNIGTATHLQKYIIERKRNVSFPKDGSPEKLIGRKTFFPEDGSPEKLLEKMARYIPTVNFLLPMAMDSSINQLVKLLDKKKINYTKAEFFKISFPDMRKKIDIYSYDMLVFFSPYGIESLMLNYPDFQQGKIVIGTFGTRVLAAAQEAGLNVQIVAPAPKHPSIFSAVDKYLRKTIPRWKIKQ